jgi:hypothetical protein
MATPYEKLDMNQQVIELWTPGSGTAISLGQMFRFYQAMDYCHVMPPMARNREVEGRQWTVRIPQAEAAKTELAATQVELAAAKAEIEALKAQLAATQPKRGAATPALERLRCATQ